MSPRGQGPSLPPRAPEAVSPGLATSAISHAGQLHPGTRDADCTKGGSSPLTNAEATPCPGSGEGPHSAWRRVPRKHADARGEEAPGSCLHPVSCFRKGGCARWRCEVSPTKYSIQHGSRPLQKRIFPGKVDSKVLQEAKWERNGWT